MNEGAISGGEWLARASELREEGWRLTDLCGLDRLGLGGPARFEVVCQLIHPESKQRRTLHVTADGDPPTVPSVTSVWPVADFLEREAYDMFGIVFSDHPDLKRILMPDEWEGYPLRKDYSVGKVVVEFAPQPFLQIDAPGQAPDTQEAGRDVDELGQAGRAGKEFGNAPGADEPKAVS